MAKGDSQRKLPPAKSRLHEVADDDSVDEEERLSGWLHELEELKRGGLPPVLIAAIASDGWNAAGLTPQQSWLGNLVTADILRSEGKTASCLLPVNAGLRPVRWERRRSRDRSKRITGMLEAITEASQSGLRLLERLELAHASMKRRLTGRRSSSHLPGLIDLVLSRPLVSAGMIAKELGITNRAALNLIGELGVREITGRGRFRAWGVF